MTDPIHTRAGKTARNEAAKLKASWFNAVSAAFLIGAIIQPTLVVLQAGRTLTLAEGVTSAIFLFMSRRLFVRAQRIAESLED